MIATQQEAFEFFSRIHSFLNEALPHVAEIRQRIPEIVASAKASTDSRHKAFAEAAFLNEYIAPLIHRFLVAKLGLSKDEARHALLSESFRALPEISSASPARSRQHPFQKALGVSPRDVINQWRGEGQGNALVQSCPDLAIRSPAPIRVVIEGKYFAQGGLVAASSSLAKDIYQSFFYLALSNVPESATHPAWEYDFSCLLAYDATLDGSLIQAWREIDESVRRGIWEGGNIYVMLLRRDA